jgi:hypothetical protein
VTPTKGQSNKKREMEHQKLVKEKVELKVWKIIPPKKNVSKKNSI